jgi:hypothetical protein
LGGAQLEVDYDQLEEAGYPALSVRILGTWRGGMEGGEGELT